MPRRNIVQVRLNDTERAHAAGEASRAGQRLAEWGRGAVKAILLQRVVRQLEQVRDRLTLREPEAWVTLTEEGVVEWDTRQKRLRDRHVRRLGRVGMQDKRELLEATAEWLIGEAGK